MALRSLFTLSDPAPCQLSGIATSADGGGRRPGVSLPLEDQGGDSISEWGGGIISEQGGGIIPE